MYSMISICAYAIGAYAMNLIMKIYHYCTVQLYILKVALEMSVYCCVLRLVLLFCKPNFHVVVTVVVKSFWTM